jgi:hypothetical protein
MLDADIYGPSQPMMLGISGRPESKDGKRIEPMEGHGLQASSIGFLIDVDTPMVWRGPMVTQALEQLLKDTNWRDLDYLVVDLPPGTGDIQLTLAQKVPVTGADHRHHAAGHRPHRRPQGPQDVREGRHPDPRHRREHVVPRLPEVRARESTSLAQAAPRRWRRTTAPSCSAQLPLGRVDPQPGGTRASATVVSDPDGRARRHTIARSPAAPRTKIDESQRDMTLHIPEIVVAERLCFS